MKILEKSREKLKKYKDFLVCCFERLLFTLMYISTQARQMWGYFISHDILNRD
jgi:hypothetical protein